MEENDNTPVDETTKEDAAEATVENAADETPAEVETADGATTDAASVSALHSKRQEKIGLVTSNKMTKTVVVRVERQVRHPKYKRYIRRRKKFMAHDEIGVNIGDIVKIIETRPMSARKRWRVVEVVQKAS
jgi:small subunit ribosomal protein S17